MLFYIICMMTVLLMYYNWLDNWLFCVFFSVSCLFYIYFGAGPPPVCYWREWRLLGGATRI